MPDPDAMVELWRPRHHVEAHAIKQALAERGIPCHIDGESVSSWAAGSVDARWSLRLLTLQRFHDDAIKLIESPDGPLHGGQATSTKTGK